MDPSFLQTWEEGQAFKDIHAKLKALADQKEMIEAARKAARKRLPLPGHALPAAAASGASDAAGSDSRLHPDDWVVQVRGMLGGAGAPGWDGRCQGRR